MFIVIKLSLLQRLRRKRFFPKGFEPSPGVTITISPALVASLTIAVSPTSGRVGDSFVFSGVFRQNGTSVAGAAVGLFKDGIHTMIRTQTASDGSYSLTWTATSTGTFSFYAQGLVP